MMCDTMDGVACAASTVCDAVIWAMAYVANANL